MADVRFRGSFAFCRIMSGTVVEKLLGSIGKNTLEILIFHNIIAVGLCPFSKFLLSCEPSGIGLNILFLIIVTSLCILIGFVIRKIRCLKMFFFIHNLFLR